MFGLKSKTKTRIQELEKRLTNNSKVIEEDHHNLQELTVLVKALTEANQELVDKVAKLESRQENLRDGLRGALSTHPSTPELIRAQKMLDNRAKDA